MLETPKSLWCYLGNNPKDNTMDNQQATDLELGWLSGIIDGEGCFTLAKGSNSGFSPGFKLVNTNEMIVTEVIFIFTKLKIPYFIYNSFRTGKQRPAKRIEVNGIKRLKYTIELLLPYLMAKKLEAQFMLDWINIRLSLPQKHPTLREEWNIYYNLRDIKKSGASETTRET
jgi:hypothetical protein